MSNLTPRNRLVDQLFTEFGKVIGIGDLAFDETNLMTLEMDGVSLIIEARDEETGILLKSEIAVPDAVEPATFVAHLTTANVQAFSEGLGLMGLDTDLGAWVWLDRIRPAGLTAQTLSDIITRSVRNIRFWQSIVDEFASATATSAGVTPPQDHFIRI